LHASMMLKGFYAPEKRDAPGSTSPLPLRSTYGFHQHTTSRPISFHKAFKGIRSKEIKKNS
jgi:hypothetical protein